MAGEGGSVGVAVQARTKSTVALAGRPQGGAEGRQWRVERGGQGGWRGEARAGRQLEREKAPPGTRRARGRKAAWLRQIVKDDKRAIVMRASWRWRRAWLCA